MFALIFRLKQFLLFLILFSPAYEGTCQTQYQNLNNRTNLFSIFSEFLYWHASQETSSSWAYQPTLPNITTPNIYFNWSHGVKVGLDSSDQPPVRSRFYWTYFSTQTHANAYAQTGQILFPEFFNGFTTLTPFTQGAVNWNIILNMFDFEISREFTWLDKFSSRPYLGVKGGTINQHIHSNWNYQGDIFSIFPISYSATEQLKNNFSGIGPSFGLDNKWSLPNHFHLVGDVSGAWLWGIWNINDVYQGPSLSGLQLTTTISSHSRNALGALMLRYFAGLDWTYEAETSITFKIGYEMQFWMNQLRIPVFQEVPVHGDLTLQGGTCGILIKFS